MRLAVGGLVDRSRAISFRFDGKEYRGFGGDTLASALMANGVKLVGRSFKYHRPRGIVSAGSEEPNALVELRGGAFREANTRATMVEIFEGLEASSQNRFPSLKYDVMAVNSVLAPLFAAGFYYKTFMWPAAFWEKVYEPAIRRAAGLGRASGVADPDVYEQVTEFCDVLVIGAGAAGRAAAAEAVEKGLRVVVCDEGVFGEAVEGALFLARTTVFGVYDSGTYGAVERLTDHLGVGAGPRQRLWRIVAVQSVLASGAIERPLVFENNDRPGVMLAGAVEVYLERYGVAPGRRGVVFGNHDGVASVILALAKAGVAVAAVVDVRGTVSGVVRNAAGEAGAAVFAGACVAKVLGGLCVEGVEILDRAGGVVKMACDFVAMSGGWNPAVHLTSHLDGKPVWDEGICAFVAGGMPAGMSVVGAAAGVGINAGIVAYWKAPGRGKKAFVDFQNDVTASDVALARQEGFVSVEHLKRYTTLGMATDQGKTSNVNGLALMAAASGKTVAETGTTKFRPPYTPVAIGVLAGAHRGRAFKPVRETPTHEWAKARGAVFVETGLWLRAQYFPVAGEDWLAAVTREVKAVRAGVGICDVTTLGKIDVQGRDAAKFLDFVYANGFGNLAVGRARYGLMLREDGFVLDDGTVARLGENHYLMTTTTAQAGKVFQHLEFCHQWLQPGWDVSFCSVTDQWAQIALAGPRARDVLRKIVEGFDVSNEAFGYMGAADGILVRGVKGRVFRLSFSGELAYEVAVPARFGNSLAGMLMEAGEEFGIVAYGTEALGVMRIEKGHPAGNELNGQTTAHDLGFGKMLSRKKDFVGRALAGRAVLVDEGRARLVGLKPVDAGERIRAGAHLLKVGVEAVAAHDEGWVSSVAFSPVMGCWIGLGFLKGGMARVGERVRVYDPLRGGDVVAEVVAPVFYDVEGERLRA